MSSRLSPRLRLFAAMALGCACTMAFADGALDHAGQRSELRVGVDYVVPPFVGGSKVRTPEAIDIALAEEIATRLHVGLDTVHADRTDYVQTLKAGDADVVLAAVPDSTPAPVSTVLVQTGYSAGPMAIMRDDTDIKTWEQLKGRTVCLAQGGLYVGTIAAKYGAIEKIYKAPADAFLALRTGKCDATVHDDTMLNELIKFPEWKKFSARLPVLSRTSLAFVVPADDPDTVSLLKQVTRQWKTQGYLAALTKKRIRDIAFEVYLDQVVPDCH